MQALAQKKIHTETSSCCIHHTNEPQATILHHFTCLYRSKVAVFTDNTLLFIYPWLKNIDHYLSTMQKSIMLFKIMEILFRGSLCKLQLHHYARNAIISILNLTTIFRISINFNILRQTAIYPVPSDTITYGNGFIHTDGILRMIVTSTVFVEVGNMVINKHS